MSRIVLTPTRPISANERLSSNVADDNSRRIPNRVSPNNVVVETQKEQNAFELANGQYGGAQLQSGKGTVQGQGGTAFTKEQSIPSTAQYSIAGCVYNNTVNISGKVVYNNCRFEKLVTIQSGAKVIFNGCVFTDSGQVDNSAGVLADCVVIGSMRVGTPAHLNATIIGEVA